VPPKDLGSIIHLGTWNYSFDKVSVLSMQVSVLGMKVPTLGTNHYKYRRLVLTSMWHALVFLKSMVKEHRIYRRNEFSVTQ